MITLIAKSEIFSYANVHTIVPRWCESTSTERQKKNIKRTLLQSLFYTVALNVMSWPDRVDLGRSHGECHRLSVEVNGSMAPFP